MQRQRIVFNGRDVVLIHESLPPPGEGEMQVRTEWTQVSIGTEVSHIAEARAAGESLALGYSNVGIVETLGPGAEATLDVRPGDRVLVAAPHASRANVPATPASAVRVPDGLAADLATLGILGSIAYHIVQRANPRLVEPTAVVGQGVVGSLVLQLAKRCGARPLIALDLDAARRRVAMQVGADHVLDAGASDAVEQARALTGGDGVSLCIEAAASPAAYQMAIDLLRLRGRLVATSAVFEPVAFRINPDIVRRELTILGAHQPKCPVEENAYYPWTQPGNRRAVLEDIRDGRLMVEHLISHRIKPADASVVYQRLCEHDHRYTGVLLDWRDAS